MKYAFLILQLIPVLIDIMKKIEETIGASNQGVEKLEAVRKILAEIYPHLMDSWSVIEKIIAVLVNLFNMTGTFKK